MTETHNIEYKESWRDEYLRQVCGMANTQGGSLFVGVDDNGNVVGVSKAKKLYTEYDPRLYRPWLSFTHIR